MQSVFKFPIALAVLDKVDKGELRFNQRIFLKKSDLRPNTWSPLREKYKNGNVYVSLKEILRTTMKDSDNNGCDILLKLAGGPGGCDRLPSGKRHKRHDGGHNRENHARRLEYTGKKPRDPRSDQSPAETVL